jgi:pimeloyl-ACP methyl ester carboxylesterase
MNMTPTHGQRRSLNALLALLLVIVVAVSAAAQDRNPVILIPGLTGSELRDKKTGERVWFKTRRSRSEDLRLPLSLDITKMGDGLEATDVLRNVKIGPFPVTDVYGGFIKAMEQRGGYREENWDNPGDDAGDGSLFVFAYDWRLDNVTNSRRLIRQVESVKKKLGKPDLKFDIVAHSMGGIIARYAVMYGDAELPAGRSAPKPTFAGSKHFDKIVLLGTPNEGSALALQALVDGFSIGGLRIDLPWAQDTSKFMVFTVPSAYQLLPAPGTFRLFDENLEPVEADLYDPKVWTKYGWNVIQDKGFTSRFGREETKIADRYFAAALSRAKRLHEALAAAKGQSGTSTFFPVGADCKTGVDAIVVHRNGDGAWKTLFRPKGFTRIDGYKYSDDELKNVMQSPGDGIVSARSLEAASQAEFLKISSVYAGAPTKFICEDHHKLAANSRIQDYVISVLAGKVATDAEIGRR